jgi:chitodextrinase
MMTRLGAPGDQLVATTSGNALLRTHAVRRADGTLDVLIDNEDPGNSYTVNLTYNGYSPSGTVHVYTLANHATTITSGTQGAAGPVTVGPYSLTVLQVPGSGGSGSGDTTPPSAPTNPHVTGTTGGSIALGWTASTDNVGVAAYDVYRDGTRVGSAAGTAYTDSGLAAGTSYTYTVRTRDAAGNVSAASSGVTGTTAGGGTSSGCSATYHVDNDWGGGFTATVTVSNTGTTPTGGWRIGWAWAGNQQLSNAWNTTANQSGVTVTATDAGYNGAIAPGGNTSFGFQATYGGANAAPALACTAS